MRPLLTLSARYAALATALVGLLGVAAGAVRLLPWFVARDVPLRLVVPFAELLAARTLEVAFLVGMPMGVGIAAAVFVERGEARALGALGARPARLVAPLVIPGLLGVAAFTLAQARTDSEPPGRFAARLIAAGRASCTGKVRTRVDVPLVALSWLCFEQGPRLAGAVPGLPRGAWFTARDVELPDGLASARMKELHLAAALPEGVFTVGASEARVDGLPAWSPPRTLAGAPRALVVGAGTLLAALGCAWAILGAGLGRPVAAATASGAVALALLAALRGLDVRHAAPWLYVVLLPVGALLGAVLGPLSKALRSHVAGI
jgi:hypothetical protein